MLKTTSSASVKLVVAWIFCVVWRLFPFRPPNVEPILATLLPFGRAYGMLTGFIFAVGNVLLYDVITGTLSQWTAVVAVSYGLIGLGTGLIPQRGHKLMWYVGYAIVATIVFDFLTGVAAGAILFGMGWKTGLMGQIPFTMNHLISNVILSLTLSPLVDWLIVGNRALSAEKFFGQERMRRHL